MKHIWVILLSVLLTSCATTEKYTLQENVDSASLAKLFIYRTKTAFHSLNPEKPFFYLNDKLIAKLGTGQFDMVQVPAGKHRLSVRQSLLFMPGTESDAFEFEFEAGNSYYLRYDYSFGDAAVFGDTIAMSGTSNFHMTTKENYFALR